METLIRVHLKAKASGYAFYIFLWAQDAMDAMDAIRKLEGTLLGPDAEYTLEGAAPQRRGIEPITREKEDAHA